MKLQLGDYSQRDHHFAIVDEVDSILIDEARTPLIISGPAEDGTEKYLAVNKVIPVSDASAIIPLTKSTLCIADRCGHDRS